MLKIKSLYLKNYAGFNDAVTFNFMHQKKFKAINMFFGPNGCGKSTALNAISLLGRAKAYAKREKDADNLLLRKLQFHPDYDPNYAGFTKYTENMEIIGTFTDGGKDLFVQIKNDDVVQNDLLDRKGDSVVFIDADNPINTSKFQIPADHADTFVNLAKAIYGYDCWLEKPVSAEGVSSDKHSLKQALAAYANNQGKSQNNLPAMTKQEIYQTLTSETKSTDLAFYQDFVIDKRGVKVHYKSMSAGEKKIATLLRNLCDPAVIDKSDIILVDNIEMHVYFKRHTKMIDKILTAFPSKQFVVTSHSGIMIEHVAQFYGADCLFDIPIIKGQPLLD